MARSRGCDPRDVVFTSGGTEANNVALRSAFARQAAGRARDEPPRAPVGHPRGRGARARRARARSLGARARGRRARPRGPRARALRRRRAPRRGPGGERRDRASSSRSRTSSTPPAGAGARVHVDAVQAFGRIATTSPPTPTRAASRRTSSAGRSRSAPCSRGRASRSSPVLLGGSQERGVRPGTTDPVAAAGLAAAARHALTSPSRWRRSAPLRDALEAGLLRLAPGARVNGAGAPRMPHVTNVAFPGWRGPELVAALDLEGVAVSAGSACSAGTAEPSAGPRRDGRRRGRGVERALLARRRHDRRRRRGRPRRRRARPSR